MLRSRLIEIINGTQPPHRIDVARTRGTPYSSHRMPLRYASGFDSPAASLDGLFEHSESIYNIGVIL